MDSEKSVNLFEIQKRIGYLIIYWKIIFCTNLLIIFRQYYCEK